jgi:transcriptional regulator with XRE-family HTH domain
MSRKGPDAIDKLVGRNVRIHRLTKGLSQTALADRVGLTFQQIQKYEKGTNRVGSGRLFQFASILGVPITAFFEGSETAKHAPTQRVMDRLAEPHSLRLLNAFSGIPDPGVRRSVLELVEKIASTSDR